jgi:hypothetical protein
VRPLMLAAVALVCVPACVERTLVIGDDRTAQACADAVLVDAPPSGCTTVPVESRSPYGCSLRDPAGHWLEEHAGTWVRLRRPADREATLRIVVLAGAPVCGPGDGGVSDCGAAAELTTTGDAPCACVLGSLERHPLSVGGATEIPLVSTEQEVLLEPFGATFEVSLCAGPSIAP